MYTTTVGALLVHGIGEQRRFEHLESQARAIATACLHRATDTATVELLEIQGGTFLADHPTWAGGAQPSIRITVVENNLTTVIHLHEVWWADLNEAPGVGKWVRFWMWGLGLWAAPTKHGSTRAGFAALRAPGPGGGDTRWTIATRFQLFAASWVAVLGTLSLGLVLYLAKRLGLPDKLDVLGAIVNYVSGVKIYLQKTRAGGEPLDNLDARPRTAIRRRMVRAIFDIAAARYDRWYVLAHSMGSVIAFNGLMEPDETLPGYLDEARWAVASANGWTGKSTLFSASDKRDPPRPAWVASDETLQRAALFAHFEGLLTYGSPLDKFAVLWGAKVAINTDAAPLLNSQWINVYDPTDPVANRLQAFDAVPGFAPVNYAYRASPILLLSHLAYLQASKKPDHGLADTVAAWFINGSFSVLSGGHKYTFINDATIHVASRHHKWSLTARQEATRRAVAMLQGVVFLALVALLGTIALVLIAHAIAPHWLSVVLDWLRHGSLYRRIDAVFHQVIALIKGL